MAEKTKIIVIIPDGMADLRIEILGGRTPMETAYKPCMDFLAENGICGMVKTIPDGMIPESDTANLVILGYDPKIYSKGRAPLEAVSMGLSMRENDTAFRCNLVTLSEESEAYEDKIIIDHSADEITTNESDILIKELDEKLGNENIRFYTGISYRHCILWENCPEMCSFMQPHDILTQKITEYLPDSKKFGEYFAIMKESYDILKDHPINKKRREKNLKPANSIWLWSPGVKPKLPQFKDKYNLNGSVVAAVNLIKGIGICAGLDIIEVEGATGNFHTNYKNKGLAAIEEIKNGKDFVFVHIEAPDECGHRGEIENKVKSIEKIDDMVISPIYNYLNNSGMDYKIIILPDHSTPISIRTHAGEPMPFLMYHSANKTKTSKINNFNEYSVKENSDIYIQNGYELLDYLLNL